jgi:hypothetical protein
VSVVTVIMMSLLVLSLASISLSVGLHRPP